MNFCLRFQNSKFDTYFQIQNFFCFAFSNMLKLYFCLNRQFSVKLSMENERCAYFYVS